MLKSAAKLYEMPMFMSVVFDWSRPNIKFCINHSTSSFHPISILIICVYRYLEFFCFFVRLTCVKSKEEPHSYLKDKHNTMCFWVRLSCTKLSLSTIFVESAVQLSTTTRIMAAGLQHFLLLYAFFWYCMETFFVVE